MPSTRSTPVPLHYRAFESGAPLVILHGLFGCWPNSYPVAQALADRFRVFAVDQHNHGDAGHAEPLDYEHLADDVRTFLEGPG
jgi:esterase